MRERLTPFRATSAPTEQPPRKLSGTRTAWLDDLERGASLRPPKGNIRAARCGLNSQVPRQMGTIGSACADPVHACLRRSFVAHIAVIGAGITGITTAYALID